MYPFRGENVYVRNAWYVGCLAEEVGDTPFERVIMDKPLVFFRTSAGKVAAMHGLCPHRYYPLALHGKVIGESLQCHYHGYAFDGHSGLCVHIPSAPKNPRNFKQQVYPVIERGPWVWIWPGDPSLADASKVPTLEQLHLDERFVASPMLKPVLVKSRYMLALENLMDLTHLAFLHSASVQFDEIIMAPLTITETDAELRVARKMRMGWGMMQDVMYKPENRWEGICDADSETIVHTPGYVTNTGSTPREVDGIGKLDPAIFGELWFHHALTPSTRSSTYYFGTQSRNHRREEAGFGDFLREVDTEIRSQDIEAVEAIELRIQQFGQPTVELMTRSDTAAARLRRRLQKVIELESSPTKSADASTTRDVYQSDVGLMDSSSSIPT
jgi:phenylpropionate dioxygenase-like ring-hydroxylating dioxygenase large terminal subunit